MYRFLCLAFISFLFLTVSASSEKASINGVELDYLKVGDGPPLYLLHGGMESRDSFEHQIPVFAEAFTVIALDSRKQGRSGTTDLPISYAQMSSDVRALAKHLGHEKISIVGLSDGGITAITTAIEVPELIDRLVLLGATYHYDSYPEEVREFIASYRWDGNTDPNRYPGNFIRHYLTGHENLSGFGDLLDEMAKMWTTSPTYQASDLKAITAPTLVINGDHEDTDLDHALSLYRNLSDAQLFVVPNGTHYAMSEQPELVNKVMLRFLTSEQ
ncbi:MAG: alpha/beta hydrolase [Pseudomonadota bacterium]